MRRRRGRSAKPEPLAVTASPDSRLWLTRTGFNQFGKRRKTAIDRRTTRQPGYNATLKCRKRIEEIFAWVKTVAGLAKARFRGQERVDAAFTLALAAYNLIRLPKLLAEPA